MASSPSLFLVIGSGGHGRVVGDLIRALGHRLCGYVDANPDKVGREVDRYGSRVLLEQSTLIAEIESGPHVHRRQELLALGVGDNVHRMALLKKLSRLSLPSLVHPDASVSPTAVIGAGTVVFARAVINTDAHIGQGVIVNSGAIVEHDCKVADGVHISPGAVLSGGVSVGERSWIASGAVVIHQISIGDDCVIGAGAVVVSDVPDGMTVVGNPARPIARNLSKLAG